MLSVKRLSSLSASKIQSKINFDFRHCLLQDQINKHCDTNILNLFRSFSLLHNLTRNSKNPQLRYFNEECKAAFSLFKRSNLPGLSSIINNQLDFQGLHTTPPSCKSQNNPNDNKNEKDKEKADIDDNMPSLLLKAAFWMLATSILVIASSLLVLSDNTQNELIRYVSWKEFVYSMLSKGEVDS